MYHIKSIEAKCQDALNILKYPPSPLPNFHSVNTRLQLSHLRSLHRVPRSITGPYSKLHHPPMYWRKMKIMFHVLPTRTSLRGRLRIFPSPRAHIERESWSSSYSFIFPRKFRTVLLPQGSLGIEGHEIFPSPYRDL